MTLRLVPTPVRNVPPRVRLRRALAPGGPNPLCVSEARNLGYGISSLLPLDHQREALQPALNLCSSLPNGAQKMALFA